MKITIVTGFFLPVPPVIGGSTEKIWHRLAQEFAAAGHEVTFVSRTWPGRPAMETVGGVTHLRIRGAEHRRSLALNLALDFWWGIRVARVLPPADVVICNTVTLPVWLRRLKPSAGRVAVVVARMPKGHGRAYGGADLLLSLSKAVTEKLSTENPRLASRIVPFPYPIDWKLHADAMAAKKMADALAGPRQRELTIGYVGRIHPEKGLRLLLSAADLLTKQTDLPPWRLELVGPWEVSQGGGGEMFRSALVADYGRQLGTRLVLDPPEFDAAELARRYGAMDIFCYPSLAERGETFGVAVAEAMATGAAPVVSDLACFNELVRDGDTGLVFDHRGNGAAERLAEALAHLLRDSALRHSLAQRAQAHVCRYDYADSARTLLDELRRLVSR